MMRNISLFGVFFATFIALSAGRSFSPEDVDEDNLHKLALANNEFAFNLHRKLALGSSDNVFFSPLSISTALGMLLYGARGETSEELRKVLGFEKAQLLGDLVHETFSSYFRKVIENRDSSDGYVLKSANSILVDKNLQILDEYRRDVQDLYSANARNVEFARESPKIVAEINHWVRQKTNGKIDKFLDSLSPTTVLALLNAVYFKGSWETPFEYTIDGVFYNNGLDTQGKTVQMMRIVKKFPVAFFQDFRALELPYEGKNASMFIFVPKNRNGLQDVEKGLTPEKLADVQKMMHPLQVSVSLPKFKLETEKDLSESIEALGANRIFSSEADFSGITPHGGVSVSQVLHKAVIEVNEEGSEAAGVTVVSQGRSGPYPIKVDHPFVFTIVEKGSGRNMILFMGRVNNL